jgi:hypothetical protein
LGGERHEERRDVLRDTIQPFPTFSEIYADALEALRVEIASAGG